LPSEPTEAQPKQIEDEDEDEDDPDSKAASIGRAASKLDPEFLNGLKNGCVSQTDGTFESSSPSEPTEARPKQIEDEDEDEDDPESKAASFGRLFWATLGGPCAHLFPLSFCPLSFCLPPPPPNSFYLI
jgi:hypothetical protein